MAAVGRAGSSRRSAALGPFPAETASGPAKTASRPAETASGPCGGTSPGEASKSAASDIRQRGSHPLDRHFPPGSLLPCMPRARQPSSGVLSQSIRPGARTHGSTWTEPSLTQGTITDRPTPIDAQVSAPVPAVSAPPAASREQAAGHRHNRAPHRSGSPPPTLAGPPRSPRATARRRSTTYHAEEKHTRKILRDLARSDLLAKVPDRPVPYRTEPMHE